jgi:HlyD family secretion protein
MRGPTIALLIILLIVLLGAGFYLTNPEAARNILVELELVESQGAGYLASGLLEAETYAVSSLQGGKVLDLPAAEGGQLSQGATIAVLESEMLAIQLNAASARLESAQALFDQAQDGARQVDLKVGLALISLSEATLRAAEQAVEDAHLSTPISLRDEQVELAETHVEQALAELDAARAAHQAIKDGSPDEVLSIAQAAVTAAEAEIGSLQQKIDQQTLESPIAGILLDLLYLEGELALPGQIVATIANLQDLSLIIYLPEADLGWVQIGTPVVIQVDPYPQHSFPGEVVHIASQAEFTPRNVQTPDERSVLVYAVKIHVSNPEGVLKPGLPADAIFEVQ